MGWGLAVAGWGVDVSEGLDVGESDGTGVRVSVGVISVGFISMLGVSEGITWLTCHGMLDD
jgi:hypothetical protein